MTQITKNKLTLIGFCLIAIYSTQRIDAALNKTVKVAIIKAELKSVVFTNDHNVLIDYYSDFKGDGTSGYSFRGWSNDGTNNPVSYTKGTNVSVKIKFRVTPAEIDFAIVGENTSDEALCFLKEGIHSKGSDQEEEVTAIGPVSNTIGFLEESVAWYIKTPHAKIRFGTSGPHKIFITWSEPLKTPPTLKRMEWVTSILYNANTISIAAERIRDELKDRPGYTVPPNSGILNLDAWDFYQMYMNDNATKGECMTLANLASVALNLVGIPAESDYAYPTADGSPGYPPVSGSTCRYPARRLFVYQNQAFSARLVYSGNRYEGYFRVIETDETIKAYTVFYPGGPFENQTYYPLEIMHFAVKSDEQIWVWDSDQTINGVSVKELQAVPSENPVPLPDIP